jgi:hypothetical protein
MPVGELSDAPVLNMHTHTHTNLMHTHTDHTDTHTHTHNLHTDHTDKHNLHRDTDTDTHNLQTDTEEIEVEAVFQGHLYPVKVTHPTLMYNNSSNSGSNGDSGSIEASRGREAFPGHASRPLLVSLLGSLPETDFPDLRPRPSAEV